LFAVDYPYESTAAAVAALEQASIPQADKEKVAFRNARGLLGL